MVIAQFRQNSAYAGASLDYSEGRFGVGAPDRTLSVDEVVGIDHAGGLEWRDTDTRMWFYRNRRAFEPPVAVTRRIDPVYRGWWLVAVGAIDLAAFTLVNFTNAPVLPAGADAWTAIAMRVARVAIDVAFIGSGFGLMRRARWAAWVVLLSIVCAVAAMTARAVVAPVSANVRLAVLSLTVLCVYLILVHRRGGLYRAYGLDADAARSPIEQAHQPDARQLD